MPEGHPRIPEVLAAYELLLNEAMALDYCGITGKDRKIILNDPAFSTKARKIKAEKYIEEINDLTSISNSLKNSTRKENARIGDEEDFIAKKIELKMKVANMRRSMLSLTSNDKEGEESESLNIFFIDLPKEEFERMLNIEIHEGDADTKFISDISKEAPMEGTRNKKEEKKKSSIPAELSRNVIVYTDENGDTIKEEVFE